MDAGDWAIDRWGAGRSRFTDGLEPIIGIQLLLWSLGGFIFATHSISWVRGQDGRAEVKTRSIPLEAATAAPFQAAAAAGFKPEEIELRMLRDVPVYEVRGAEKSALVDARNGDLISPIPKELAERIAVEDRQGSPTVQSTTLLEADPPTEYREGELPAWRVVVADEDDTHIYISASTGRITARRNNAWRRFDFFWMLHTMDYRDRDSFNHPLLIGASSLAMLSVLSGFLLWGLRVRRRHRRRKQS